MAVPRDLSPGWSAAAPVYRLTGVHKSFGERSVLADLTLAFPSGSKVGVIGPNGSGKSTLLRIMAGLETPSSGAAVAAPDVRTGLLGQEPWLDPSATVRAVIEEGVAQIRRMWVRFGEVSERLAADPPDAKALLAELGELGQALDDRDAWDLDAQLAQAMHALRCPDPDTPVAVLSGGERRRWRCAGYWWPGPTCCCSTGRPTTSMR